MILYNTSFVYTTGVGGDKMQKLSNSEWLVMEVLWKKRISQH